MNFFWILLITTYTVENLLESGYVVDLSESVKPFEVSVKVGESSPPVGSIFQFIFHFIQPLCIYSIVHLLNVRVLKCLSSLYCHFYKLLLGLLLSKSFSGLENQSVIRKLPIIWFSLWLLNVFHSLYSGDSTRHMQTPQGLCICKLCCSLFVIIHLAKVTAVHLDKLDLFVYNGSRSIALLIVRIETSLIDILILCVLVFDDLLLSESTRFLLLVTSLVPVFLSVERIFQYLKFLGVFFVLSVKKDLDFLYLVQEFIHPLPHIPLCRFPLYT